MFGCHEGRQHFDLQAGDFGQEANAIRHAAFMGLQNIQHITDQVERPLLDAVAAEDNLLRVYPIRNYQCRLLVGERSAGKADGVIRRSVPRWTIQVRRFLPTRMPKAGVEASKCFPIGRALTVSSVKCFDTF